MWITEILHKNMLADHDVAGIMEGGKKCLNHHFLQRLSSPP